MQDPLEQENASNNSRWPWSWLRMLSDQLHWSFVYGVVSAYGICQGLRCGVTEVASNFYWKDVQKLQPSQAQFYDGMTWIPWIVKPIWDLLTDVVPVQGYRMRPYFILAGTFVSGSVNIKHIRAKPGYTVKVYLSVCAYSSALASYRTGTIPGFDTRCECYKVCLFLGFGFWVGLWVHSRNTKLTAFLSSVVQLGVLLHCTAPCSASSLSPPLLRHSTRSPLHRLCLHKRTGGGDRRHSLRHAALSSPMFSAAVLHRLSASVSPNRQEAVAYLHNLAVRLEGLLQGAIIGGPG